MISLSDSKDVLRELYDTDEEVRKQFQNAVAGETIAFAESFAYVYSAFDKVMRSESGPGTVQRGLVLAFLHGVLDDVLTSVKLLLSGKLGASGNLARQSVEGLCMAIMCAHPEPLLFGREGKDECIYWQLVVNDDPRSEGNRAPHQTLLNVTRLRLSEVAAAQLKKTVETHHGHSHAGRLGIANRVDLAQVGKMYFGGHFDSEKLEGYQAELKQRIGICKWAHETIVELTERMKNLPTEEPAAADGNQLLGEDWVPKDDNHASY